MTLDDYKKKVDQFLTNNVTAMMGAIQLTSNERTELQMDLSKLSAADQTAAIEYLKSKGIAKL